MSKEITSVREALLHEALKDIDDLITRLSGIDETLSKRIEDATSEAVGRSYHSAHNRFKSLIDEKEQVLLGVGRNAASIVHTQLNTGITQLIAVNESMERRLWRLVIILAGFSILGGVLGGMVAVKLIGV